MVAIQNYVTAFLNTYSFRIGLCLMCLAVLITFVNMPDLSTYFTSKEQKELTSALRSACKEQLTKRNGVIHVLSPDCQKFYGVN